MIRAGDIAGVSAAAVFRRAFVDVFAGYRGADVINAASKYGVATASILGCTLIDIDAFGSESFSIYAVNESCVPAAAIISSALIDVRTDGYSLVVRAAESRRISAISIVLSAWVDRE